MSTRLTLAVVSFVVLIVHGIVFYDQFFNRWEKHQTAYFEQARSLAKTDAEKRALDERSPRIEQIIVTQFGESRVDRCATCHIASDDPRFQGHAEPLRTHPFSAALGDVELNGKWERRHKFTDFGCTICHDGQGRGLETCLRSATTSLKIARLSAPLQRWVGVGKVGAEIAESGRTEHGVCDRVCNDVGIAVTLETWLSLKTDPSQDQAPCPDQRRWRSDAGQSRFRRVNAVIDCSTSLPIARSSGEVSFKLWYSPGTTRRSSREPRAEPASSVASGASACARRRASARKACGVCTATSSLRSRVSTTRPPRTRLTVSATASAGNGPVGAGKDGVDHGTKQLPRGQRPGGVVDDDDVSVLRDRRQAPADRGGSGRASRDHPVGALADPGAPEKRLRHYSHDAAGHRARRVEAPLDHGPAAESGELLGLTESPSLTGGDNDHPDLDAHAPACAPCSRAERR